MAQVYPDNVSGFVRSARDLLREYGRDYALGAVRGLAVRNMISVTLPPTPPDFYPLVKIHEMALRELEDLFYSHLDDGEDENRGSLVAALVKEKVWE